MIGFQYKTVNLRISLVICAGLLLTACAKPMVKPEPQEPVAAPQETEPQPDTAIQPAPHQESLTASLMYGVLLGEIAGQRGQLDISGASYLQAAQQSNDPRIAERALKISMYAKQPQLALQAARRCS